MKNEKVAPAKVETVNAEIIQNELVNGLVNYLNSEAEKVPAKKVKAEKDAKRHTDKELREISKGADIKGTFKIVRFELLESDTSIGLDPIHRAILVATKSNSAVYKLLTEKCTKLGKAKDKFNRLSILRALNNFEAELQILTAAK
jgi:hypothetical protein